MYVVRRAFRNYGQMMAPGSVVEPAAIKRFKSRIKSGNIIEVPEQDFDRWDEYFAKKYGVPIGPLEDAAPEEAEAEAPEHINNDLPPVVKPKESKPVPIVKIVSK